MYGRAAGTGMPILFGGYLLYSYLPESRFFAKGHDADLASVLAAMGGFLLIIGVVFLIRNLK
jgi:hypothetical protein